jgi:hypothetical protein
VVSVLWILDWIKEDLSLKLHFGCCFVFFDDEGIHVDVLKSLVLRPLAHLRLLEGLRVVGLGGIRRLRNRSEVLRQLQLV